MEGEEGVYEGAQREIFEELNLQLETPELKDIGLFPSRHEPNVYIQMFLAEGIEKSSLQLQEGKAIAELTLEDALSHEKVTDFTKEVLLSL